MRSARSLLTVLTAAVVVMLGLVSGPAGATEEPLPIPKLPTLNPDAEPGVPPENLLENGNVEGVYDETGTLEGYFDEQGKYFPLHEAAPSESQMLAAEPCTNIANGDYVHRSSGDASGHGWWLTDSDCKYRYSKVYVALYEWYTDNNWRRKAYAGPLSKRPKNYFTSDQVTARRKCDNSLTTTWKSFVSSTLSDTNYAWKWTSQRNISCRVY